MNEKEFDLAHKKGENESQMIKLISLLGDLTKSNFFGKVEIALEDGRIVLVRKTQNIKL